MGCQVVSRVVHSARLCTTSQHSPSGTWLTTILTCRLLHVPHPLTQTNSVRLQNLYFNEFVTGALMPPIQLSYPAASAATCNAIMLSLIDTSTLMNSQPMMLMSCSIFDLSIGFAIELAGFTLLPTLVVTWKPPVSTDSAWRCASACPILCD